jgi:hypothetical protein
LAAIVEARGMTTEPIDPTRREDYMGRSICFHFVDVFATEPLTGNPLVVVQDADGLPDALMQRMAYEFNQSETTFVLSPTKRQADRRLRSFTPRGIEVFGVRGHNTLGAWWWLAASGAVSLRQDISIFHQEIGGRVLPVTIVLNTPQFLHICSVRANWRYHGRRHADSFALPDRVRHAARIVGGRSRTGGPASASPSLQPPAAAFTRCLTPKTYAVGPQPHRAAEKV